MRSFVPPISAARHPAVFGFVFRIPLSLPVFSVPQCETWERRSVCFSNQVLMSSPRKACGVKRLSAASYVLRLMQMFDFHTVSDLLLALKTYYSKLAIHNSSTGHKRFILLEFPRSVTVLLI